MIDYSRYPLNRKQRIGAALFGCAACCAAAWLVCRHPAASAAAAPVGLWYPRLRSAQLRARRANKFRLHFKEMLQSLTSLLAAGRSVENAFLALENELALLLADTRSDLLAELRAMANRLRNGEPLEGLLRDLANRAGLEEVRYFAEAIAVCKRAGGDLVDIARSTSQLLGEKLEVELELSVLMAQKRFESRLLMAMPFALIGFLGFFAPDYMAPLRQGVGWVVLAVCLALLGLVCWWMARIMKIEV